MKSMFDEAAEAFFNVLDAYSLADLVTKPSALRRTLAL